MRKSISYLMRQHPLVLAALICSMAWACQVIPIHSAAEDMIPVSVIGVQHLGKDYLINQFYVNKSITDSVGEFGGGGSRQCCVSLPGKWTPKLKAEVRWEVSKIIRPSDQAIPETAEFVARYKAVVPIENYDEPSHVWVHFFSNGRVRIVVTPYSFDGNSHPILWGDDNASLLASQGEILGEFFTGKELVEFERRIKNDRKKFGDWR